MPEEESSDEYFMRQALREAAVAFDEDEIPIGAVIVQNNRIIARGHNQTERLNDCTAHAEIIALTSAFNYLGSKYLPDATLYVTVEPCLMCAGALYWSKIGKVVYGADDDKNGYRRGDPASPLPNWPFHPKTTLVKGLLAGQCAGLMRKFFKDKRG
ncbi:MAG TPA: nucleoside deaminase [Puia sp.]|nr:nucleoside deaminase [Puia sp.]